MKKLHQVGSDGRVSVPPAKRFLISRQNELVWFIFVLAAALFVVIRSRYIGHLLSWDEAMNLLTARSLFSGGHDWYSYWFWRHPPLFNVLTLLLQPLAPGYAERVEWLSLALWTVGLIPLFLVNRRAFGATVSLASILFLAFMPGAIFFGTWIKEDVLVILFGLTAFLLFDSHRYWLAGLALGLAFLSKELAFFYAIAIAVIWVLRSPQARRWQDLAVTAGISLLTAVWWYHFFSVSFSHFWFFAIGKAGVVNDTWSRPWFYFYEKLAGDLGWVVLVWLAIGVIAAVVMAGQSGRTVKSIDSAPRADNDLKAWPWALLVPSFIILTLVRSKTPWYVMSLYPALATLSALGLVTVLRFLRDRIPPTYRRPAQVLAVLMAVFTVAALTAPRLNDSYAALADRQEPMLMAGAQLSERIAVELNKLVADDDRVLLTQMFYWTRGCSFPCPILVYYFKPAQVVFRPNTIKYDEFIATVRQYRIDWAVLSPPLDSRDAELSWSIMRNLGLQPVYVEGGACVFRTTSVWRSAPDIPPPR